MKVNRDFESIYYSSELISKCLNSLFFTGGDTVMKSKSFFSHFFIPLIYCRLQGNCSQFQAGYTLDRATTHCRANTATNSPKGKLTHAHGEHANLA